MSDFLGRKPWTPAAVLVFGVLWGGMVTVFNVCDVRNGYFHWGRGVNPPIVRASQDPLWFWSVVVVWQIVAAVVMIYAGWRFWCAKRSNGPST